MRGKDTFFISLFAVGFLISSVVMSSDFFSKTLEQHFSINHTFPSVVEAEDFLEAEQELVNEQISDAIPEQTTEQQESVLENTSSETEALDSEEEETLPLEFQTVDYSYFDDALLVGDSRMEGIMEYGNLSNADFFAYSGMNVFALEFKKLEVSGIGKITFDEMLERKQYGKVYLMLGLNELGYQFEGVQRKYQETIEKIRAAQEDAIIYLCANMHVTTEQSQREELYNNENVNLINEMIAGYADGEKIFYIDVNELFDDETGGLAEEYSSDAFHVLGKHYVDWVDWLCTKAIVVSE